MKKLLIGLFTLILLIGGGLYAVYYFGTEVAADQVVESVTADMKTNGQMDQVKTYIEQDPVLSSYLEEAEAAKDDENLVFTTRAEATRVMIQKVGIGELRQIQADAEAGNLSEQEVIQKLESSLSEEELKALKVLAYKEIYGE
ncbi:hypothetical protein KP77_32820 [Jeotgalibacillus alimentarius]|uniref:Phenylalanyl-tRNA synthetase subunit beta n=1 Tax=Jeotgalibacillus alimentarius TaxID=135826 RepID=A0A0C2VGF2_9BACL|nr:phenylalanyl-tRNA synthetase subunit beta [Jeotgalibacillus alimentarius]KIL43576.1 hypothetical protein KP77_32820 [Jeotgalibacillus alimentarius]